MTGWLTALGPEGTALALLLLGHVLGDFVFQTDALARNKHRWGPLLAHAGIVLLVHGVAFIPLLTPQTVLIIGFVGAFHFLIDAVSARIRKQRAASAHLFLGDQMAHLVVLLVGWSLIDPSAWTNAPVVTSLGGETSLPWSEMTIGAVYLSAFVFAHEGGNTIVRGILPADGPESPEGDLEAGSLIGSLERWLILVLGLAGRWEAVALVVAVKSIARFEELKQRPFAEYFLVGTLASVLVAIALVVLVSVLV
ncbi:hypothetical protein Huta_1009 [Halorhabdus utahensis DSM 12940]|uniref:DUF3307 domain-containing protein n=1 Tax=Halorhabdus utahensis (strain DSM 12940 / JCM 11049 / AX-2) TaxID=519442 RepID=C7NVA8_HALUD|nr:DUF3307 domain-containing protein [Halorhabdus utahensis]ACV11192.1 hypothetical protein Huta_1009 [Halorhabdus utahensis DSM 12940]